MDATGGSWFGILLGVVGLTVALGGALALWRPQSRPKFIAGPGAFLAGGLVSASLAATYLTVSSRGDNYSHGTGVWLALIGGLILLAGGVGAALGARPGNEPARVRMREVIGIMLLALFLTFAGASGSWILDQRSDAAQIAAELAAEAEGVDQGGLAAEVLAEAMSETRRVTVRGFDADGPGIGYIVPGAHPGSHGGGPRPPCAQTSHPAVPRLGHVRAGLRHHRNRLGVGRNLRPFGDAGALARRQRLPHRRRWPDLRRLGLAGQQAGLAIQQAGLAIQQAGLAIQQAGLVVRRGFG